jgi:hypothetical protein
MQRLAFVSIFKEVIETPGTMTQLTRSEHAQYGPSEITVTRTHCCSQKVRLLQCPNSVLQGITLFLLTDLHVTYTYSVQILCYRALLCSS